MIVFCHASFHDETKKKFTTAHFVMDWFVTRWMIYLGCLQGGRLIDVVRCDHCINTRYLGNLPKMWLCTTGSSITRGWERKSAKVVYRKSTAIMVYKLADKCDLLLIPFWNPTKIRVVSNLTKRHCVVPAVYTIILNIVINNAWFVSNYFNRTVYSVTISS
jgi:hypothetical protein